MKLFYFCILLTVVHINLVHTKKVNYDNYTVYRVLPKNGTDLKLIHSLQKEKNLDFWTEIKQEYVDIMVPPKQKSGFKEFMYINKLDYSITVKNVQKLVDSACIPKRPRKANTKFSFDDYYRLNEINAYLASLEAEHIQANIVVGGRSYEGRNITGVNVSYKKGNPVIIIEGGIHAREWISPATVLYLLTELLTSTDKNVRYIAENYDWYLFPSINPDGYEYSHSHDRLWRRTRSPTANGCFGVDANRNFNFHWKGPHAFSEIETKTFSEFITSQSPNLWGYIGFHSHTQMLLIPYGHTNEHLDNYEDLLKIGKKAITVLAQKYGTQYRVGSITELLYPAFGTSMDWVKGVLKTPITFTYELRDNTHDFCLPADKIIPNGEEVMDSLVALILEAEKLGY